MSGAPVDEAVADETAEHPNPDDEVITGEIVDEQPVEPDEPTQADRASAAIEAAANAALAMPGVPGRDEFLTLAMQARMLSLSAGAPKAVRENVHLAFHIVMVGRDLGISPTAAIELIDVISSGGEFRLSLSPQLINGQVRRLGLGSIVPVIKTENRCVAVALAPAGSLDQRCRSNWPEHVGDCRCVGVLGDSEFTWRDAQIANLAGDDCQPGDHNDKCWKKESAARFKCNQGYRTYPRRMMWWRAAGFCADDYFPEAGLGLYSPEALGAVVDEHGRPIDPATVALPEGYGELPAGSRSSSNDRPSAGDKPISAEQFAELWSMYEGLRDDTRGIVHEKWAGARPLTKGGRAVEMPALDESFPIRFFEGARRALAAAVEWDRVRDDGANDGDGSGDGSGEQPDADTSEQQSESGKREPAADETSEPTCDKCHKTRSRCECAF